MTHSCPTRRASDLRKSCARRAACDGGGRKGNAVLRDADTRADRPGARRYGIAGRRRESVAQCVSRACAGRDRAAGRRGHAGMAGTGDAAAFRRRSMKRELAAMLAAEGLICPGRWWVAAASEGGEGERGGGGRGGGG